MERLIGVAISWNYQGRHLMEFYCSFPWFFLVFPGFPGFPPLFEDWHVAAIFITYHQFNYELCAFPGSFLWSSNI